MKRKQEGVTVVLMALLLTGLCGMAALAVDVGVLFGAKNEAQNAADAAALAGAFTFLDPAASQPQAAINAAIALGDTNSVLSQSVTLTAADVTVDEADREVTVNLTRTGANAVPMFFARVLGINSEDLIATSTAQASPEASGSICLRPIFIPNTILSTEPPAQACSDGQTILGPNGQPSPWFQANVAQLAGTQFNLRPIEPKDALAPSQFYSLDFGSGGSTYEAALGDDTLAEAGVSPAIAACGVSYATENGDMPGPTQAGIGNLVGPTPDTFVGPGAYQSSSGTVTDTSRQLIVAPVWNNCTDPIGPGKQTATVIGYSNWFIQGMSSDGSGVVGNFINAAGCAGTGGGGGAGAGGNGVTANGAFGIPVRLVNPSGS